MNTAVIALQDNHAEAGAIVWWSLARDTDILDMVETLEGHGFDESWIPTPPRIETIVQRAARAMARGPRELVRPLETRGQWEYVTEHVEHEALGPGERLVYTSNARISVTRDGDTPTISVVAATEADAPLAEAIRGRFRYHSSVMNTVDMSNWLLRAVSRVQAVSLRDRGGFYFVPKGPGLETWRRVVNVVDAAGAHQIYSMPAMRSDDAVRAILSAVRREADAQMSELEEYMVGEVITIRGLNAWTRKLEGLQGKAAQYAELLGVELPELTDRAETLLGGIGAARMLKGTPLAGAAE